MNQTPKKPSVVGTIIKGIVATLFILVAFDMDDPATLLVSLVIGLAFLAWAVLPYIRYKQDMAEFASGRRSLIKKPMLGFCIFKVAMALVFIIMAFDIHDSSSLVICLVLGAVFLAWAAYPFLQYKKAAEAEQSPAGTAAEQLTETVPFKETAPRKKHRLCPYCGAPMSGETCEYCGMDSWE